MTRIPAGPEPRVSSFLGVTTFLADAPVRATGQQTTILAYARVGTGGQTTRTRG